MNFLAHIFLSTGDSEEMLGNLLGDFCKYIDVDALPLRMRQGIQLHRVIDRYTDFHPVVLQSQSRVSDERGRFAGVLVDVFYDHFLARDFERWAGEPLRPFVERFYGVAQAYAALAPEPVPTLMGRMVSNDWLNCYAFMEGIDLTLQRIATRLSRPTSIATGVAELRAHYDALGADFEVFFPQLIAHVKSSRQALFGGL